jgi:hypothetical protein
MNVWDRPVVYSRDHWTSRHYCGVFHSIDRSARSSHGRFSIHGSSFVRLLLARHEAIAGRYLILGSRLVPVSIAGILSMESWLLATARTYGRYLIQASRLVPA